MELDALSLTVGQILITLPPLLNSYFLMGIVKPKSSCFPAGNSFPFLDSEQIKTSTM